MNQLRYILSLLFFFSGFFSENIKAEVVTIKSEKVETLSEQNFQEQTSKEKWLGLLHLQKESLHQNQISSFNFSIGGFNQNFSEELCLKGKTESSKLGFQLDEKSTSYQGNGGCNDVVFNDDKELVDAWSAVSKHADLSGNVKFLENISGYSDDLLKQLDDDLLNPKWQKWSQREFFKEVTALGKRFEEVTRAKILNKSSDLYTSLKSSLNGKGLNIDDYKIYDQVQVKYAGDDYFVADFVMVRKEIVEGIEIEKAIVIETKLRDATKLTTPQANALNKVKGSDPSLITRSSQRPSLNGGSALQSNTDLEIEDFIKVWGDGTGETFSGLETLLK